MAGKVLATRLLQCSRVQNTAGMCTYANKIGNREVVCYGMNGDPTYIDRVDFPMPAIRYKEPTADIQALREKEKGDWKKLSIDEKKALYRASFCQTFAEINAPTGEWKSIIGWALFGSSLSLWIFMAMKKYVYPPLPVTFDEEHQLAQLDRIIKLDMNPIDGINARK
ncbi:cytochrome c oxidase subunit 4 isoform 1, mitochondrial [Neodiprion virginianus]|uniref:cytochrome c oxidase subunit 4 isoform 1, mitochondrial n=1 Tax=Neodiprion virginianus TaxID=2961670 RepID=UPI001EE6FF27|nr:cytochrome c oxidase subunit 4 isoform 1, mitochondrial [Neodiprion virginianus]